MRAYLDDPSPQAAVDPLSFLARGWVWLGAGQTNLVALEARAGETLIGSTRALYLRPDVAAYLKLPAETRTGFDIFAHHPALTPGEKFALSIHAVLRDGRRIAVLETPHLTAIGRDYRQGYFGTLLDQNTVAIQRHANIFVIGPSVPDGSPELVDIIARYLRPPPHKVIDVGCGLGFYGRELRARGYDWLGVEVKASDCAELARQGLPHRQVEPGPLPFAAGAFDTALCIEVLEHIDEPRAFLKEVKRVAPRQLIVSVPNCEVLGYLHVYASAPWHMLEADHKNFFTRWSLGSLLREFYDGVELRFHGLYPLRTPEGTPLYYNLLAIATAVP